MSPCEAPRWLHRIDKLADGDYDDDCSSYGEATFKAGMAAGDLWYGLFGELMERADGHRPDADPSETLSVIQHAYPDIFRQITLFAGHVGDQEWAEAKRAVELAISAVDKAGGPDCVLQRLRDGARRDEGRKIQEAEA